MLTCSAYAALDATAPLVPFTLERRDPGPSDVVIEILYCGVCHSDLHTVRSEWGPSRYPVVPGHEIVGRVIAVGGAVNRFKVGDMAGVGCLVDSCRTCQSCRDGLEQYCDGGIVGTYNDPDRHSGGHTFGGYSSHIVVDENFTLRIPDTLDPASAAPLLCAGITTYSPMRHWKVGPGQKVGVVGLGGLGHMAVKIAHAMGARVVMITGTAAKIGDAHKLGADEVLLSSDPANFSAHASSFDYIIDTVAAKHDINAYIGLLKRDGTLTQVGAPPEPLSLQAFGLIFKRRNLAGSLIGGLKETQEMLDFCAAHHITADVELIPIQYINEAYERMNKSDVKYRFVIDLASLKNA